MIDWKNKFAMEMTGDEALYTITCADGNEIKVPSYTYVQWLESKLTEINEEMEKKIKQAYHDGWSENVNGYDYREVIEKANEYYQERVRKNL